MEEIIKELRAQMAGLEAKLNGLETANVKTSGDIQALADVKASLLAEIEAIRGQIAAREEQKNAPPAKESAPGVFGLGFADEVAGE